MVENISSRARRGQPTNRTIWWHRNRLSAEGRRPRRDLTGIHGVGRAANARILGLAAFRLHRVYWERGRRFRIVFQPEPTCWTEVPESLRTLARQRNRWQRGTLQVLFYHARMLFNPWYGVVGLLAMPYYLVFEAAGLVIELTGYVLTALAIPFGLLDWRFAELFFLAAIVYGALLSVAAIALEELSFRRYPKATDLLRLVAYGVLENFGYRQLARWWRIVGVVDYFRGKQGWGTMKRKGFATT